MNQGKKLFKNDYALRVTLRNFVNENPVGRLIKPLIKDAYHALNAYLPYPRDFLLKMIPKDAVCCEVGVYQGFFSERIVKLCKPKKLYLVDPWMALPETKKATYSKEAQDQRYGVIREKFKKEIQSETVALVRKTSDEAVTVFPDGEFDFVYIDGDHSYAQVKKDLENYYPKVKSGGILSGDDYNLEGVGQAVDEFVKEKNLSLETKDFQFIIKK